MNTVQQGNLIFFPDSKNIILFNINEKYKLFNNKGLHFRILAISKWLDYGMFLYVCFCFFKWKKISKFFIISIFLVNISKIHLFIQNVLFPINKIGKKINSFHRKSQEKTWNWFHFFSFSLSLSKMITLPDRVVRLCVLFEIKKYLHF